MKKPIVATVILLMSTTANAWFFSDRVDSNYKEYCLLDLFSQAKNDQAARFIDRNAECNNLPSITTSTPSRLQERTYSSKGECVQKHGIKTPSELATRAISRVCGIVADKTNSRQCSMIIDSVIGIQEEPSAWSRTAVRDWYINNPSDDRPEGFNAHCL
jgi:hypothetical protein